MNTYFARHTANLGVDDATRQLLWDRNVVAIHFPGDGDADTTSLDPEDYDGPGRTAMRCLAKIAKAGGYVCAEHHGHDEVQLGSIPPDSRIELLRGMWGSHSGRRGRTAILKSLTLTSVKKVSPADYAVLLVGRPRRGTLNPWRSAGSRVECLVEGRPVDRALASLFERQQETLCNEFLRTSEAAALSLPTLASLALPVGRTMKDLDIIGLATDGKPIFAQVTFSKPDAVQWKLKRLRRYDNGHGCYLLMFCDTQEVHRDEGVILIPLNIVFTKFTNTEPGARWLDYALGKKA